MTGNVSNRPLPFAHIRCERHIDLPDATQCRACVTLAAEYALYPVFSHPAPTTGNGGDR